MLIGLTLRFWARAVLPFIVFAANAPVQAQSQSGSASALNLGMLAKLVGRTWVGSYGLQASVTIAEDGRYKIKVASDTHYVNPGISGAPSSKTSVAGTVLLESSFEGGQNGFILTGMARAKHITYFIVTPEGGLRYLMLWRHDGVYRLHNYMEFLDPAHVPAGQKLEKLELIQKGGKKFEPEIEARLGVTLANAHALVAPLDGSAPIMVAAPSSPAMVARATVAAAPQPQAGRVPLAPPANPPTPANVASGGTPSTPISSKLWASMLPVIGSHWKIADRTVSIAWDRQGEAVLFAWDGLYGRQETLLTPTPDGKQWKLLTVNLHSGDRSQAVATLRAGRIPMNIEGIQELDCAINRKTGQLDCRRWQLGGAKKVEIAPLSFARTDAAGAQALLATFPGRFPKRKAGSFHPVLGAFADMAGSEWVPISKPGDAVYKGALGHLIELRSQGSAINLIYQGEHVVLLSGSGGSLRGTAAEPVSDNPNRTVPYAMAAAADGTTDICLTHPYDGQTRCDRWRISIDGQYALQIGRYGNTYYRRAPPLGLVSGIGVFGQLHGRVFDRGSAGTIEFVAYEGGASYWFKDGEGQMSSSGSFDGTKKELRNGQNKIVPFVLGERNYQVDSTRYVLSDHAIDVTYADGKTARWPEISRGIAALNYKNTRDRREYREAVREYREIQREKAEADRRLAAQWNQIARDVGTMLAGGSTGNGVFQPSTPADWAARLPQQSPQSNVPGYASSMGGVTYTAAPPMTPQQRMQAEELERFRIREQLYGKGGSTTVERPYQKAYEQLDRDRAESARQLAQKHAQEDARFEEERRAREQQETNDGASRDNAAQRADQARQAEAQRQQAQAAEAERKRREAEALRKQKEVEELAAAEREKKRLAAEAEAKKKQEELAAKVRYENELIDWREGVVLCEAPKAPSRNSVCHGPLQTTRGTLDTPGGDLAIAQACGNNVGNVREIGQSGEFKTYGCNYGIHPSPTMRSVPLHGDPAERFGVFVPGRAVFRCPRKQTNVCK